jgi:hypothetical protein
LQLVAGQLGRPFVSPNGADAGLACQGKDFVMGDRESSFWISPIFLRYRLASIAALLTIPWLPLAVEAVAQENFPQLIQQAREQFQPVTPDQLSQARAELNQRIEELERFVRPATTNGQRWLNYLRWDTLRQALSEQGPPNLEGLDATLRQLRRDENGLELPKFRRLADALDRYRNLVAVSLWENPADLYGRQLEALGRALSEHSESPTPASGAAIGQRLRIIADLGQAPELVQAVRREFARPNVYLDVATALVAVGVEPIDRTEQITDNILGTRIRGDAHTSGTVSVASIPSADRAVLEFMSQGISRSQNVGRNGPAVICSSAETDFVGTKRVELSDALFAALPAVVSATTHSDIHSISKQGGGLGSRLVSRIGWQRARESHGRADAIASDHAEDRIERRFNDEVNDELHDARQRYDNEYRRPLVRRGELPQYIRFSSDEDSLSIQTTQASGGQLAATGPPPQAPQGHDVALRLHESAVGNYAATLLGGATASETEPGQDAKFNVKLPEWMKDAWQERKTEPADGTTADGDRPFKQWSMTFRDRPISVDFDDHRVKLTTHIARLQSGDQTFANWDITGTYTAELDGDGGVVLRRDGDLVVLPANFRGSLTSRQTAERSNLEKEINERSGQGRGFPGTIEFQAIEPEGALTNAGPLEVNQVTSDDEWIVLAWDRRKKGE